MSTTTQAALSDETLAEHIARLNEQARDQWRQQWEGQDNTEQAAVASYHQDYSIDGEEYVPGAASNGVLTKPQEVRANPYFRSESSRRTPLASSIQHVYPTYFQKMSEAIRSHDQTGFYEFMQVEGSKWALAELPVDELVSNTGTYWNLLLDLVRNDDDLCEDKVEIIRTLSEIVQASNAALLKGYVEGRDKLLIRTLSSNRPVSETNTLTPVVKGTIMGGFGEQVRRSLDELEALHKVNSAVNSSLDLDSVLNLTVQAVSEVMGLEVCSVWVHERNNESWQDRLLLRAAKGLNQRCVGKVSVTVGEGVTGASAKEGRPISVYDIWADTRFQYVPELNEEASRSMLSVPIILFTREEKLVGVINVQSRTYRNWTTEEIRFLEMVAGEIALAIENAQIYQQTDDQLRHKVQELTTLQNVSKMIAATLDLNRVLDLIVQEASKLVGADMASIYELKEGSQYLTIVAGHGLSEAYTKNMRVRLGNGPVGRAAEFNRPENVWDAYFELHEGEEYYFNNNQYRSAMCVPLAGARGVLGVICLYTYQQRHFNDEQLQIISSFADQAAIAIENARLYEEARRGLTIKSALLREMHHRVRNNLQTVAALLSMQMRRADNIAVSMPLAESVARIQSIAAVHDLLCREDIGVTTVYEVAKEIMDIASVSLVPSDKRIHFKIDEGRVPIASKEATLLAILIMELISNAIFHGFENRSEGEVRISSFLNEDGRTQIEIRDNGRGYPDGFDPVNGKTGLGLQIVHTLVTKDLQGAFRMENINGWATATISFNSVYGQPTETEVTNELIVY